MPSQTNSGFSVSAYPSTRALVLDASVSQGVPLPGRSWCGRRVARVHLSPRAQSPRRDPIRDSRVEFTQPSASCILPIMLPAANAQGEAWRRARRSRVGQGLGVVGPSSGRAGGDRRTRIFLATGSLLMREIRCSGVPRAFWHTVSIPNTGRSRSDHLTDSGLLLGSSSCRRGMVISAPCRCCLWD